jgi:DnaK suppressor protein
MSNHLTQGQRALLQQLLEMRQFELDRRMALRGEGASRSEQAHEALQQDSDDAPQRDADREIELARADRDVQELGLVSDALARLHESDYGVCADCGQAIPFDRLKLEPWARRCVGCESRRERSAGAVTRRSTI